MLPGPFALHVLVVHPEATCAHSLERLAVSQGHLVLGVVPTAQAAFEALESLRPDLIIFHLDQPFEDILSTVVAMRDQQRIATLLLADVAAGSQAAQRLHAASTYGFLPEPFDPDQLCQRLNLAARSVALDRFLSQGHIFSEIIVNNYQAVWVVDMDGIIRLCNPASLRMFGVETPAALVGEAWYDWMPDYIDNSDTRGSELLHTGRMEYQEFWMLRADGSQFPASARLTLIHDQHGEPVCVMAIIRDISLEKQFEKDLRDQASRAAMLARIAAELNAEVDVQRLLDTVCKHTAIALNVPIVSVHLLDPSNGMLNLAASFEPPDINRDDLIEPIALVELERYQQQLGSQIYIPDLQAWPGLRNPEVFARANIRTVLISSMVHNSQLVGFIALVTVGETRSFSCSTLDLASAISDLAAAALERSRLYTLVRDGRERQQALARQLVQVQESERAMLSRELHDHFGQLLTGLQFSLEASRRLVGEKQQDQLVQAQGIVADLIRQVRDLSIRLHPSMLDDLGLLPALQWHVKGLFEQTGLSVSLSTHGLEDVRFRTDVEIASYRIVQEALTNVARHSGVKQAIVRISASYESIEIEVVDKGRGFDTGVLQNGLRAFGLTGLRERAENLGGLLEIHSVPGKGTRVTAHLPAASTLERRRNAPHRTPG